MRDIRFRAWDKEKRKMVNQSYLDHNIRGFRLLNNSEFEFMQFTGLLDKNGKEIYEGDIVNGTNLENFKETTEVKWDSVQWYPLAGHRALEELEVIGNVWENGDLKE